MARIKHIGTIRMARSKERNLHRNLNKEEEEEEEEGEGPAKVYIDGVYN